ncbi:MAG: rane protein, partial [Sphingomonas bacterium]|nr:rane protein [Sphingomonas bacterium]
MRVSVLLAGVAMLGVVAGPAAADTLRDALVKAYNTNPGLAAARADVRATDENVPIAKSAGRPNLSLNGGYTENALNSSNSLASPDRLLQGNTQLTVPLFRGGRVANSVKGAEIRSDAARDQLRGSES